MKGSVRNDANCSLNNEVDDEYLLLKEKSLEKSRFKREDLEFDMDIVSLKVHGI